MCKLARRAVEKHVLAGFGDLATGSGKKAKARTLLAEALTLAQQIGDETLIRDLRAKGL